MKHRHITALLLATVLISSLGFKCSKQQTAAVGQDVIDGLKAAESQVLASLPQIKTKYLRLEGWAVEIKAAFVAADTAKARDLIAAFLPTFDDIAARLGANRGWLALVDIGIHFALNHLPSAAASTSAAHEADSSESLDVIERYRARPVWGCQYRPEKCK